MSMTSFFQYFIAANGALLVFYIFYRVLLRPLTFYLANRIFLMFAWLFSLLLPLFVFPVRATAYFATGLGHTWSFPAAIINARVGNSLSTLLLCGFILGTAWMTIRLFIQAISLYRFHLRCERHLESGIRYCYSEERIKPFSFWNSIYMTADRQIARAVEKIILHETIHIKGRHSLDVLLSELMLLYFWINPAGWLLNKAIRQNLEYLTDNEVLKRGVDPKEYQYCLVSQASGIAPNFLFPAYFSSDLKNRIYMMNKVSSTPSKISFFFVLLPLLLGLCYLNSACSKHPSNNSASLSLRKGGEIHYIIDGEPAESEQLELVDPAKIHSIQVYSASSNSSAATIIVRTKK